MKNENRPEYFDVYPPAHFAARPDLVEELCAGDAILRQLCRTEKGYRYWHALTGNSPSAPTLAELRKYSGVGYELTSRYIFRYAVLPHTEHLVGTVVDQREWPGLVEHVGLFDFVFCRAVERIAFAGYDESYPREQLYPSTEHNSSELPRFGAWSIGYGTDAGNCTILDRTRPDVERRFLCGEALGADDVMENLPIF